MANLNLTNFADAIKVQYEKRLLSRALPRLIHGRWLTQARLNKVGSYELRKYGGLAAISSTLASGVTPEEQAAPSLTPTTISPAFYGAWIGYTDLMDLEIFDPYISEVSGILGEQAGLSADTIVRDYIVANGTIDYSNDKSAVGSLDAPADNISYRDFLIQMASFEASNVPPSSGRTPVIIHPHSYATLMLDPVFVNLFTKESDPLRNGYVGYILNYEFFVSSNAYEAADVGAGSTTDVYGLIFMGPESVGCVGFSGNGYGVPNMSGTGGDKEYTDTGKKISPVQIIGKPLGSGGTNDPLNQRGTLGWKMNLGLGMLNADWVRVVKHTNIFSDM